MTSTMTPIAYLEQGRTLREQIDLHSRQLRWLQLSQTSLPSAWQTEERVRASPAAEAAFALRADRIADLEYTLAQESELYGLLEAQIRAVIDQLPLEPHRIAFRARYLQHLSWKEVAEMLCMATATVRGWHTQDLKKLRLPFDAIWMKDGGLSDDQHPLGLHPPLAAAGGMPLRPETVLVNGYSF